jgi:predicted nucleotidyltransferase
MLVVSVRVTMKEMKMLDLDRVDLATLAEALDDHSWTTEWRFDPVTGESIPKPESMSWEECDVDDPERLIAIEPEPSSEGYGDMQDFIARVSDPRAREFLERAIAGRGAFRRFKDTLFEFEDLREAWFALRDARAERRALGWLRAHRLISDADADAAIEARPDPESELLAGTFDARAIAAAIAADLRELYGERLRDVILFGSWARGDADRDSDIDLLVVLDEVESSWEERKRMDDVLAEHSIENDTVVSAIPVSEAQFANPQRPFLIEARRDAVAVA